MGIVTGGRNCGLSYLGSSDTDWNLLGTLSGATRTWGKEITFSTAFSEVPTIVLMLRSFDVQDGEAARISLGFTSLTATGFILRISTSGETSVFGVGVNWLAYDSATAL